MASQGEVEVLGFGTRIAHTLNLVLYTLLVLTGVALLSIETFAWLIYPMGVPLAPLLGLDVGTGAITAGAEVARAIHRFLGPIWGILLVVYGIYMVASRRVRVFDPLRKPLRQQIREAAALASHYALGRPMPKDVEESLDRHNVLVAYLTVVLVAAFVLAGASGAAMVYLPMSQDQYRLMLLLHDLGFYLSVLFTLFHIFAVTHPANLPLLRAMFSGGTVPLEWARRHMPLYLRKRGQEG